MNRDVCGVCWGAYDADGRCECKSQPERRRLTDAEIGEIWFASKIPGLTETNARLLIRAAERKLAGEK